ncbi:FRG domain-containing protein, partial [Fusobacterium ulcerans]|uniref:FRG domain-containing protein n=1 Tax=Fusobacterium ulcerans TaxID=861 RepID=UPI002E75EC86
YNSINFKNLKKENYVKAIDTISYYQKIKRKGISSFDYLYINQDYSNILEIVSAPENTDDILYSLNEILTNINSASSDTNKKYFYRGQSNSNWMPSASIVREEGYLKNEHLMFYKIISKMPKAFEKDKYIYNQIATMQHFGYPTRLIDITENPLISLYFACEGNNNYDGEIFIYEAQEEEILNFEDEKLHCLEKIPTNSFENICKDCDKLEKCKKDIIKRSYIVQGVAQNERINNQSGNFIFVGIEDEKKYCEKKIQLPTKHIIIDKKLKLGILQILEKLNINGGTVYPDLLNLAKFLKDKYKNE